MSGPGFDDEEGPDEVPRFRQRGGMRRDLAYATRLFRRGRYGKAIAILEPLVVQYRDSRDFHYVLGASCLAMGDSGGAAVHLRRARQLDFRHVPTALALAALHVRRLETDKAVELYLEILSMRPGEGRAKKALEFLRTNSDPERLAELASSGRLRALYPRPDPFAAYGPWLAVAAALAVAAFAIPATFEFGRKLAEAARPARPGVSAIELDPATRADPVTSGGSFRFVLTEREALDAFDRAKRLFAEYRDDAGLVELNRLSLSNASEALKAKAGELRTWARKPSFPTLRDRFSYADVARDGALYEGVGVAWTGMAANVAEGPSGTEFDFLVGYDEKRRLEGIVKVELSFEASVPVDRALEVLGLVRNADGIFKLEGLALHELKEP
ncbi:MAG TPA: tetratricopeptide repeat protein [Spirochaetales bacterium]|nr:tetratricopeptide repeat protein [Spirochaetales bacterium]